MEKYFKHLIELNKSVENTIEDDNSIEVRYIESYLNMYKWTEFSSKEKQDSRRDLLSKLLSGYEIKNGKVSLSHRYEEAVIEIYDVINNLEEQIDKITNATDIVLRLKGMMFLEKLAIDKKLTFHGIRHLPVAIFENILKQIKKENISLNKINEFELLLYEIHSLKKKIERMYET